MTKFKELEWSGPAWYEIKRDKDGFPTEWKILHFHPLNLGGHAATEWEAKDLAKILGETYRKFPKLKKAYIGLIHSHNTMGAFLSGTDISTLENMAPDKNFYGSLVVASSGKELHAFGFSWKDQYKCVHTHTLEESDIEIKNTFSIDPEWIAIADKIEKEKPKPEPGNQVTLWKGKGQSLQKEYQENLEENKLLKNQIVDRKTIILDKLTSKKRDLAVHILLRNDTAEMTDIAAEDALQKLGINLIDVLTLMNDGYNYGYPYGGYNEFY